MSTSSQPPKLWIEMVAIMGLGAAALLITAWYIQRNFIDEGRARLITAFEAVKLCQHQHYPAEECRNLKSAKVRRVSYGLTDNPDTYIGDWIATYTSPNSAHKDVFLVALDLNGQVKYANHTGTEKFTK